jgi:hypothetical protein
MDSCRYSRPVKSRIGDYKIQAPNNTGKTYHANSQLTSLIDQELNVITEYCAHRNFKDLESWKTCATSCGCDF